MDDLLSSLGGYSEENGLNLTKSTPIIKQTKAALKASLAKKNKFEKRRTASKIAASTPEERERAASEVVARKNELRETKSKEKEEKIKKKNTPVPEPKSEPEPEPEFDQAGDDNTTTTAPTTTTTATNDDNTIVLTPPPLPQYPTTTKTKKEPSPLTSTTDLSIKSRKNAAQHMDLNDPAQKSEYLKTFHARPSELDRSSATQAKKQLTSLPSEHIFEQQGEGKGKKEVSFTNIGLHPNLVTAVTKSLNLTNPTKIQSEACKALILKSRTNSLFIQSETGSGKTLAYLLPLLHNLACEPTKSDGFHLKKIDRQLGGTRCIILCPTRELATQTHETATKLCAGSFAWVVPGCLSGGEKRKSEKARLRKGLTILIATPGRFLDHLSKTESLCMSLKGKLEWVVLDEADRLLDMGLGKQVEEIMQILKANSPGSGKMRDGITWRSILVSATVTQAIEKMAANVLGGDDWVWARARAKSSKSDDNEKKKEKKKMAGDELVAANSIINESTGEVEKEAIFDALKDFQQDASDSDEEGEGDGAKSKSSSHVTTFDDATPRQLTQSYVVVSAKLRLPALTAFLAVRAAKSEKVVVFMATCDGVDYHHRLFSSLDNVVDSSSSNRSSGAMFGSSTALLRMHGNVPHAERIVTMKKFASSQSCFLLATDVAARGLNLPGVDWIVQYDPPSETNDYIHRAGRAARAGAAGCALLFLLPSEVGYVEVLKLRGLKSMELLSLASTLEQGVTVCKSVTNEGLRTSGGGFGNSETRKGEAFCAAIQARFETKVTDDDNHTKAMAAKSKRETRTAIEAEQKAKLLKGGDNINVKKDSKKGWIEGDKEAEKILSQGLVALGRKAFVSYIRAYSAKEKAVRHIFSSRALHLGHIARSFALKDPPSVIKAGGGAAVVSEEGWGGGGDEAGKKRSGNLAFGGGWGGEDRGGDRDRDGDRAEGVKRKRTATGSFTPTLATASSSLGSNDRSKSQDRSNRKSEDKSERGGVKGGGVEKTAGETRSQMMKNAKQLQAGMSYF